MNDEAVLREYRQTVTALAETICLVEAKEETIEEHGSWSLVGSAAVTAGDATS